MIPRGPVLSVINGGCTGGDMRRSRPGDFILKLHFECGPAALPGRNFLPFVLVY